MNRGVNHFNFDKRISVSAFQEFSDALARFQFHDMVGVELGSIKNPYPSLVVAFFVESVTVMGDDILRRILFLYLGGMCIKNKMGGMLRYLAEDIRSGVLCTNGARRGRHLRVLLLWKMGFRLVGHGRKTASPPFRTA